ncbi:ornithine carbamoyltransferase [Halobacillus halophilus]|uniref:Ornithine carbamoyltransferase n=1 Tax=Halobacillus halophilus (strain ATCC 35676 / DSM 2266 / JCM 20832 / KCTC 3685 / LMG 17431 / NBRC 102448 / NCIMB 2269) TaxID=866895 RepID=I0JSV0_HALH3|nr:ornithine carbamoyltransferase [Halobacillus halophilus]ASF41144.1 ornithine carbamoyltransferase [Halobacillus halophilus]CCG47222.1 ornithine carbamoyltransferase [Halobacillus halophilus DSM 2266]
MNLMEQMTFTNESLVGKNVLTWLDFNQSEISNLLAQAQYLKENPHSKSLAGKTLAMVFEKSSTRTRVSFEVGMVQLGGHALYLNSRDIQIGRGETIADTAKVLSGYVDAIMFRTTAHEKLKELGDHASVPVINGLCDIYHPCQALADVFTILEEKGRLCGVKLVYIGDGNNVAHSLMIIAAMMGMEFVIVTPEGYEPDQEIVEKSKKIADQHNGSVTLVNEPSKAVIDADVIYTDVWTSMGQEEEFDDRYKAFQDYQVNEKLLSKAQTDVTFLHCLPAHRGEEVTAPVIDGKHSKVFTQAENRMHVQKAILQAVIGFQ